MQAKGERWQHSFARTLTLVLISRGTPEANRARMSQYGITLVLLQQDNEVAQAYQAHGTPSAVLVLPNGTIDSPLAQGPDMLRSFVTDVGNDQEPTLPYKDLKFTCRFFEVSGISSV